MKNRIILFITMMVILTGTILFLFKPLLEKQNLGFDLQGGFQIKYQVESIDGEEVTDTMVTSTSNILIKRIDDLGVLEPEVIKLENNQLIVRLPGVENKDDARERINKIANLTFRNTSDAKLMGSEVLNPGKAKLSQDNSGAPAVALSIKDKDTFYDVTKRISSSTDNMIVIWLDFDSETDSYATEQGYCGNEDSNCLSAATVSQAFADDVIITGNFTQEEAKDLVNLINSGSLPTKLVEISSTSISQEDAEITLNKTLLAGIIGMVLIMITMTFIYKFAGLISSIGILIYTFSIFALFYLINGSLSLSGVAAIIIGIGMAVDANVITFERIKEELYEGRSLEAAFKNGNRRSFSTIIDANITTFIVAFILFNFGESSVQGFGTMLMISIIVTIIVMVFLMRYIFKLCIKTNYFKNKTKSFIGVKKEKIPNLNKNEKRKVYNFTKLDFVSNRKKFILASLIIIVVGIVTASVLKFNLGIDFNGGTEVTVLSNNVVTAEQIDKDFKELDYKTENINLVNENKGADVEINAELSDSEKAIVTEYFISKYEIEPNISVMTYAGKQEMINSAIKALIVASILIVIYISFRFRFSYAISAIIALLHDVLIVVAIFSIFKLEINTLFVAAILAIIGYSINDTIVAFDRIRENLKLKEEKNQSLEDVVNDSLRQTFLRSIFTTATTLLPVLALIILGSFKIINFNIALFIGLLIGTYSSIFIASQVWIIFERKFRTKKDYEIIDEEDEQELEVTGINK